MDDRGPSQTGGLTYRVPTSKEATVTVPAGLLHNGWLHVLEDSEIALLLMVMCGLGKLPDAEGWVAVPAAERLLNYGLSRDAFSARSCSSRAVSKKCVALEAECAAQPVDGKQRKRSNVASVVVE